MSALPPPVGSSPQVANLGNDDAAPTWMAELEPKLDTLAEQQRAIRDILFLYWGLTDTCTLVETITSAASTPGGGCSVSPTMTAACGARRIRRYCYARDRL